ncbi:hypothetical protein [Labrys neptuniae]
MTSAIAAASLLAMASSSYADGTTDFWSLQRGFGYDDAKAPIAPAAFPLWHNNPGQGMNPAVETGAAAEPAAPAVAPRVRHASVKTTVTHRAMHRRSVEPPTY